ncbi:hypothetical protein VP03_23095 [Sinorhizobium meliloti]|uniref:hypothetical protein n=1 Tax=Rhizobium meliloti TaxID=382 RepID=UPI0006146AD0|nr:hypothetical protein [Sinorhizobium meliloti]KKA11584.1 hypothetical protein VP03_23095 [Sinorhizobium meliloti]
MVAFTRIPLTTAERKIVDDAHEAVPRNEQHAFLMDDLFNEVLRRLPQVGTEGDRRRKAQDLINRSNRPGSSGMRIRLPGLRPRPPIPSGVNPDVVDIINDLSDDGMEPAEVDRMLAAHYPDLSRLELAACWRAAAEQLQWMADAMHIECELFSAWAERERAKGRPEADLIFGNFAHESGMVEYQA